MYAPLIMEAANLYCGYDPTASTHLILSELRLPSLERNYVDHTPGGGQLAIEVATHINRLEASFTLAGWQPQILGMIGAGAQPFTVYGLIRDRRSGRAIQAVAILQGQIGRATPTPFTRGAVQNHEYAVRGIMHYELNMDFRQVFYWDFHENQVSTISSEDPISMLQRLLGGALGI